MTIPSVAYPLLRSVTEGLTFHTVAELKKLLQLLPMGKHHTRKADLVDAIANITWGQA